jgi:predicted transcriptional regulator
MAARKFEDSKLIKLVNQGLPVKDIAKRLGVSRVSVHSRIKQLKIVVAKGGALDPGQAGRIADQTFDAVERLCEIHESAIQQLRKLEAVSKGELPMESVDLFLNGKVSVCEAYNKLLAEVRKQLSFAMEIQKQMIDVRKVQEFQEVILEELKRESPELQKRIVDRLVNTCVLHSSLSLK